MQHEGAGMAAAPAAFILYHTQAGNHASGSSSSAAPWSEAAARAVKRAKNNAGAGFVYRDGESTGYEDDGSEAPSVDSWTAVHKSPSTAISTALRDNTNGHHREASTSYPAVAGLKPRTSDSPAGQSSVACTRYFQVCEV